MIRAIFEPFAADPVAAAAAFAAGFVALATAAYFYLSANFGGVRRGRTEL